MQVYQFKIWDSNFAVDVESVNFFEVDKVASEAINLLCRYPQQEAEHHLNRSFGSKVSSVTMKNLLGLKKKGMLFSEKQRLDAKIKSRITDLTLNIVNNCNLSCRYCWNSRGSYSSKHAEDKIMSSSIAYKAVDLLIKESGGSKDLVIDFYGGEPLLNFVTIKKTIDYCRKIRRRKNINFRFLLATNGTLLKKEIGKFLIENGVDIAVSIDGSSGIQNAQRPFADGAGSYETIIKNINSLGRDYRQRLVGRATFTPYCSDVVGTFNFLRRLGFGRIEVCESEKAGYGLDQRSRFFFTGKKGIDRLKSIYDKLALFYTKEIINGNLTYENTYFNRFFKQLSRLYNIHSVVGSCSAGYSLMSVDIDGSIYPCTAFVGISKFKVGTVKEGVDKSRLGWFLSTKICSNKDCDECWAKRICMGCGSCYNLNYFSNNKLGQPDNYYCELFRHKTKLMIAMISDIGKKNPDALERVFVPEYYVTRGKKRRNED